MELLIWGGLELYRNRFNKQGNDKLEMVILVISIPCNIITPIQIKRIIIFICLM